MQKPADSFTCILNCETCSDSGIVFAYNSDEWNSGAYAFRCKCKSGETKKSYLKAIPLQSKWVAEYIDKRPTQHWFNCMFSKTNYQDDTEFKRRLDIWGREWFAFKLKEWREEQKQEIARANAETESERNRTEFRESA